MDISDQDEVIDHLLKKADDEVVRLRAENTKLWSVVSAASLIAGLSAGYLGASPPAEIDNELVERAVVLKKVDALMGEMSRILGIVVLKNT